MTKERVPGLGSRIRKAREAAGLSQGDLAATAGLRQAELSKIERGDRNTSAERVLVLAKALGLSADALLGMKAPKPRKPARRAARKP